MEVVATALVGHLVVWPLRIYEKDRALHQRERTLYQRAVSRLETINAITTVLAQSLDLRQTLGDVLDKILEVLGLRAGGVYLLDEEEQGLTLVAHRNLSAEVVEGISGLKSARLLACHEGLKCKLAGVLRAKGKINGLLVVGAPEACPLLRRDVELLTAICNMIGMFVENVRLYQERTRQLEVERCVYEVVKEVTSELELDKLLPKMMQIAVRLAGADGGVVALWDEERNVITYPYLHNLPRELADVTVSKGEGLSGEVMITRHPIVIDDYQTYARAVPAFVEAGLVSVVNVPIMSGEGIFGALSVLSINEAKSFSDRDVGVLTAIGREAGIAIENAYLYENMRFYARRITQAQENERRRIARELHDDTIQSLIALSRHLEALATSDEQLPETVIQRLKELWELTGDVIRRVRRFSQDLRPSILDDLGLLPALEELTADLNRQASLRAEFQVVGAKRRLSSEVELTLFRIAQEALNNVRKHAQASKIVTTIRLTDSAVRMTVQDNGKGFKPPALTKHLVAAGKLGLIGMHERARLLGGTLVVDSESGRGTKVIVNVPL